MNYKFRNMQGEVLEMNRDDWLSLLFLAKKSGWKPGQTSDSFVDEGSGGFVMPRGQLVSCQDAQNLVNALRKGISSSTEEGRYEITILVPITENSLVEGVSGIPEMKIFFQGSYQMTYVEGEGILFSMLNVYQFLNGNGKDKVEELIRLIENSAFEIDRAYGNDVDFSSSNDDKNDND